MTLFLRLFILSVLFASCSNEVEREKENTSDTVITLSIDPSVKFQTIDNFAASDAWSCQFAGNWPEEKKNAIADWLFSKDTLPDGSPKGIALSGWRFNFGGGSAQQGEESGIKDEWRRGESFLNKNGIIDLSLQKGQQWFLRAAKQRGVKDIIGFYNSPPVQFTRNGKAFASNSVCNIGPERYADFANYIAATIKGVKQQTGIDFNYISPVNEPQWDWSDGGQEGSPYYNSDIGGIVKAVSKSLSEAQLSTKIILPETADYYYLYEDRDKAGKGTQVAAFFDETSVDYIGKLPNVGNIVAAHSYFTSSPREQAIKIRQQVHNTITGYNDLKFWQSEYCILGDNDGDIKGEGKDLGIIPALYMARLVHNDLVYAHASAWQWWLAVSPYDYKDGLVYIDMNKTDGKYYSSKLMWALGNYSRFVRPGMQRVSSSADIQKELSVSAYTDEQEKKLVVVVVNESANEKYIKASIANGSLTDVNCYVTSSSQDLTKMIQENNTIKVPEKSIVTIVASLPR